MTSPSSNNRLPANLSRRDFMRAALAAGATISTAQALWKQTANAQARTGGTLRLGLAGGATTDSLDPSTFVDTFMLMLGYAVRGNLTEIAPDGSVTAEIAESFEGADGAKTWIFRLRKGAAFSNGKTLSADDVVNSINYHRGNDSKSGAKALLAAVTDVKADGGNAVVLTLANGNADFPFVLADYHLNIMPFKDGTPDLEAGAGPYRLKSFQPGVSAILERNRDSYKNAHVDNVEMIAISDTNARQNALSTGEVDVINRTDLKTAHLLTRNTALKITDVPGRMHYNIPALTTVEPFNNVDVRLALKYGIDRQAIVKTILFGYGQPGNDQPITPSYRYYAKDLQPRAYDPDKAKFHLKKAGLDSLKVDLSAADAAFPGAVDAAVLYADQAAKCGITINVVRESDDGYWDKVWLKKPFCMAYWGGRPTEDVMLTVAYAKDAAWNEAQWSNDRFNELLVAARAELDEAKRRGMYAELQHILSDDGGSVIPVFANHVHAASTKIAHPEQLSGSWELDGGRCIERWWMA